MVAHKDMILQDPSSDGRQSHHHQSDSYGSRLNDFPTRNESSLYSTSSEFTCAAEELPSNDHVDLRSGTSSADICGATHENNHQADSSSAEYCIMDPGESTSSIYNNWYMISSNMSGGECYDNFYSAESSSHYQERVTTHHSALIPHQQEHIQQQHPHLHQQQQFH